MSAEEIREALAKMTPGPWYHYDEVFRPQFGKGRITEIQRQDGKSIVRWNGFDGLPPVTHRKRNANAAGIVTLRNKVPLLLEELAAEKARADTAEAALSNLLWAYDHADDFGPDHGAIMKLKARQAARAALEANNAGR